MSDVARANGIDTVDSPDGTGDACRFPTVQRTDEGSPDFFVGGHPVVREGDAMSEHPYPGPPSCTPHAPVLVGGSDTFFVNGKAIARMGDAYGGNHVISSGDSNFFVG